MFKRIFGIGVLGFLAAAAACNTSDASGDCTTLTSCCSQLTDASNKELCTELVGQGDATSCGEAQSDFEGDGLCVVATTSGSSGSGCAGLGTCCSSLAAADQPLCQDVAGAGDEATCAAALSSYQTAGMCAASVSISIPSGGSGCSGLSSCCSLLPSEEQAGCNNLVTEGDDATCSAELTAYQDDSLCGGKATGPTSGSGTGTSGGGSGCSGLSSCCSSLPSEEQAGCNELVTEGDDATCSAELTAYQDDSLCGGGSTTSSGSGTGTSTGSGGCSALSSCCSSLPSEEQAGCNDLVTEGNAAECSAELTAYQDDQLCN